MRDRFETNNRIREVDDSKPMKLDEAADLLFWSFYFSQGDQDHQANLLYKVWSQHSAREIDSEVSLESLGKEAYMRIEKFFTSGQHTQADIEQIASTTREEAKNFMEIFTNPVDAEPLSDIKILDHMIDRDQEFIRERRGRDGRGPTSEMSQAISYILLGKRVPGHPYFRELFTKMAHDKTLLTPEVSGEETINKFKNLIRTYNDINGTSLTLDDAEKR
jgi:hypothetical protein